MRRLADDGEEEICRFLAVNRLFMLRTINEGWPLQHGGRHDIDKADTRWHSYISSSRTSKRSEQDDRASIVLRTRKADPQGATVSRNCVCEKQGKLICGVCCLLVQRVYHIELGRGPREPLFQLDHRDTLQKIRRACASDGGHAWFTWHYLRRGMATDLLRSGTDLANMVTAGGWKSSAFLGYLLKDEIDEYASCDAVFADSDSEDDKAETMPASKNDKAPPPERTAGKRPPTIIRHHAKKRQSSMPLFPKKEKKKATTALPHPDRPSGIPLEEADDPISESSP